MRAAPAVSCANMHKKTHTSIQIQRRHPTFPAQWLTAYSVLPGDRAFLPPSSLRNLFLKNLTPASGCQDHTTSPSASAPFVKSASASTASRPAFVTIASRPSVGRDQIAIFLFLPGCQAEFGYSEIGRRGKQRSVRQRHCHGRCTTFGRIASETGACANFGRQRKRPAQNGQAPIGSSFTKMPL